MRLRGWRARRPECCEQGAHRHAFFTLTFVQAGHGHQSIDGRRFSVVPGDVCWAAPGQELDASGLEGVTGWTLAFCADAVEPTEAEPLLLTGPPRHPWLRPFVLAIRHQRCHLSLPPRIHEPWRAWLERLWDELESQPPGHVSAARSLLTLVLLDLARQLPSEVPETGATRGALLEAVFLFIEQHYRRPIGLRDVARAVGRSPAHLTDRVRRETGRPVVAWLTERRMAEARRLLRATDLPTEQVAAMSGFGDPRHFARQFRRLNGLPPQAWRAAQRTEPPKEAPRRPKSRAL